MGTLDWGHLTEFLNNPGCTLGILKKDLTDGAHLSATEEKRKEKKEDAQVHSRGSSLDLTCGTYPQRPWLTRTKPIQEN